MIILYAILYIDFISSIKVKELLVSVLFNTGEAQYETGSGQADKKNIRLNSNLIFLPQMYTRLNK